MEAKPDYSLPVDEGRCALCHEKSDAIGVKTIWYCKRCQGLLGKHEGEQYRCPNCNHVGTRQNGGGGHCTNLNCLVWTFKNREKDVIKAVMEELRHYEEK